MVAAPPRGQFGKSAALPAFTADFFRRIANPVVFAELFDVLPNIFLFVKDRRSRFTKVNPALVALHGCRSEPEMLGRTDFDFHPHTLAAQYVEEDRRVLSTREPLVDQVWLVRSADGTPRWYISSKFPIFGARRGSVASDVAAG